MDKPIQHYFDHEADIGIIGHGKNITDAFVDGARVCFAIMTNLEKIKPQKSVAIEFDESDIELAFVTWINLLINESQVNNLIFSNFELTKNKNHWQGSASGEPWTEATERGTEVKGATLTELSVKEIDGQWEARCVVDV